MHVFVQMVCALVKPTIMARKMVRASRGTDPKRPAEPRRAERRHDREAAREHIGMTQSTIVLGFFRFCRTIVLRRRLGCSQLHTFAEEIEGDSGGYYITLHNASCRHPAGLYEYAGVGHEQSDTFFAGAVL